MYRTNTFGGARELSKIGLAAALIAISSWISIPAAVPFTMQTFMVFLVCALLGGKRGTYAVLVYLLLGAFGLPVFSGFRGGFQALVGPTGGYLVGFLAAALLLWATERLHRRNPWPLAACMLLGLFVCYAFGTAWYMTIQKAEWAKATVTSVLTVMVFPYLIPDLIKIALAVVLSEKLRRVLGGILD